MCFLDSLFHYAELFSNLITWQVLVLIIFIFIRKKLFELINNISSIKNNSVEISFKNNNDLTKQVAGLAGINIEANQLSNKRVLWVDDMPDNNSLFIEFLKVNSAVVVERESTESALMELEKNCFDIIISDMYRPIDGERAGLDFFNRINELNYSPSANKYIFCGTRNAKTYKGEANEIGVKITSNGNELLKEIFKNLNL